MDRPLLWTDRDWQVEAEAWIDGRLTEAGRPRTGPLTQPHVRPWSTVLLIPTAEGDLWFKACVPTQAYEAAVVEILAQRRSDLVPVVVAVDRERGWLIVEDAGDRLRELLGPDPDEVCRRWEEVVQRYATLQIAAAAYRDMLRGAGAPDRRLAVLPGLYEQLLADGAALRPDHPDALTAGEVAALQDLVPRVRELSLELLRQGVPETIQHDDLHDGQIFVKEGRYLFLDWGDSCVSHPFLTLTVTMNSIAHRLGVDRGAPAILRVRDAYLSMWRVPGGDPLRAFEVADLLGHVCRALSWQRIVAGLPAEWQPDYADTVPAWLRAFLNAAR